MAVAKILRRIKHFFEVKVKEWGGSMHRMIYFLLGCGLLGMPACAQQTEVKPGINDAFENPDIQRLTNMFEGESREVYRFREEIVKSMALKPGEVVADVGAGTGLFSVLLAEAVGSDGRVYAVDISQELLDHIENRATEAGVKNLKGVLCDQTSSKLEPASCDVIFICDTYHHIEHPEPYMKDILAALKPGGRLYVVDFKRDPEVNDEWVMDHVRLGEKEVVEELETFGFRFDQALPLMKTQFMLVFTKPQS